MWQILLKKQPYVVMDSVGDLAEIEVCGNWESVLVSLK
jgi:hypothetical protein